MQPMFIATAGLVTGVGLGLAASCAAIRCGISAFRQTHFVDEGGEPIVGAAVPLGEPWRGLDKLLRMAGMAVAECLEVVAVPERAAVPILLVTSELERPGRPAKLDEELLDLIAALLRVDRHPDSAVLPRGSVGGVEALLRARSMLGRGRRRVVVAGVDSLLSAPALRHFEVERRLLTSDNSNGFIPGEAAGALLVQQDPDAGAGDALACRGLGLGDEPADRNLFFNSWSMNVKFEGENVPRMMDIMTHNHASQAGNTPTWPYIDETAAAPGGACEKDMAREKKDCEGWKPYGEKDPCPSHEAPKAPARLQELKRMKEAGKKLNQAEADEFEAMREQFADERRSYFEEMAEKTKDNPCIKARRCLLPPYKPKKKKGHVGCCPGQTGHHLIEAASFLEPGTRKSGGKLKDAKLKYDLNAAPCVCAEGPDNTTATHGLMHTYQGVRAKKLAPNGKWKMESAAETGAAAVNMVFKGGCSQACLEQQIKSYHHEKAGVKPEDEIDATPSGRTDSQDAEAEWNRYDEAKAKLTKRKTV